MSVSAKDPRTLARVRATDREKMRDDGAALVRLRRELSETKKELEAARQELLDVARLRDDLTMLEARVAALEGGPRG